MEKCGQISQLLILKQNQSLLGSLCNPICHSCVYLKQVSNGGGTKLSWPLFVQLAGYQGIMGWFLLLFLLPYLCYSLPLLLFLLVCLFVFCFAMCQVESIWFGAHRGLVGWRVVCFAQIIWDVSDIVNMPALYLYLVPLLNCIYIYVLV